MIRMLLLTSIVLLSPALLLADTAFTYQGRLRSAGLPVNGTVEARFSLWDAETLGTQIAGPIIIANLQVANGVFTAELDFGAAPFDGAPLWLEIVMDGQILSPRQALTAAPNAAQLRGVVVDPSNNVGIGTSTPADELHIRAFAPTIRLDTSSDSISYSEFTDVTSQQLRINKNNPLGNALLNFNPKPNSFGTATVRFFRETLTSSLKRVEFFRGNGTTDLSAVIGVDGANSVFQLQGGRIGIGTGTPASALHVSTDESNGIRVNLNDPGTGSGSAIYAEVANSNDGTWYAGRFINNQVAPAFVTNYGLLGQANGHAGVGVAGIAGDANGSDFRAQGAGVDFESVSSVRWKTNIEPIQDPLVMVGRLRGVTFDWDEDHGGHHDVGMIAEEVGQVLPEIVSWEQDRVYAHGMDYARLTPLLVEAIKALHARHETLRTENEDLRQRIDALEAQVTRVTRRSSKAN